MVTTVCRWMSQNKWFTHITHPPPPREIFGSAAILFPIPLGLAMK